MTFHTRSSVLQGELVLELGNLSVTYLTAHCEIFVARFEIFKQSVTSRLGTSRVLGATHRSCHRP
jgi:hypothetical protein